MNSFIKILIWIFLVGKTNFTFCQDSENKSKILHTIYYKEILEKENSSCKYLSVLISKDSLWVFQNDFSNKYSEQHIIPHLNQIKSILNKNEYLSLVACNQFMGIEMKTVILKNQEGSMLIISKNDESYQYEFLNLNKTLSYSLR